MIKKPFVLPLAAALAALASDKAPAVPSVDGVSEDTNRAQNAAVPNISDANTLVDTGTDYLAFLVTQNADGTIVAQHRSHSSHSSHSSHRSHSSSRY